MKTGVKTSEFWLTISSGVLGLFAMYGVIPTEELTEVERMIEQVFGALVTIVTFVTYIVGRVSLKKEELKNRALSEEEQLIG